VPTRQAQVTASPAHGHAQPGDLRQAAVDHRGPRIVPTLRSPGDAGRDRHDVLERPAEFAPDQVMVGVDPERSGWLRADQRSGADRTAGRTEAGDGHKTAPCGHLYSTTPLPLKSGVIVLLFITLTDINITNEAEFAKFAEIKRSLASRRCVSVRLRTAP
jgi:hypothetical protein